VDPHLLPEISGSFGVIEGAQVVGLVARPVPGERGDHGHDGVGCSERPVVARCAGRAEGSLGQSSAAVEVGGGPDRGRVPGQEHGDIASRSRWRASFICRQGALVLPPEVVDDPDAPRRARVEGIIRDRPAG
jgi:hypothetical protein